MEPLKASLTISRIFGNFDNPEPVRIEVHDKASGTIVLQLSISLEQFASALMGHGRTEATLILLSKSDKIGRKIESREVLVPFKSNYAIKSDSAASKKAADKAMKPFMVDGWCEYRESDLFNYTHRHTKKGDVDYQTVAMWRYV